MRLLIVGGLQGQIGLATKIAMDKGAKVTHAGDIEQALSSLRGGRNIHSPAASERPEERKKGRLAMLIVVIILLLVLGTGGGYYGHRRWGYGGGAGMGLGTIILVFLVAYALGAFN